MFVGWRNFRYQSAVLPRLISPFAASQSLLPRHREVSKRRHDWNKTLRKKVFRVFEYNWCPSIAFAEDPQRSEALKAVCEWICPDTCKITDGTRAWRRWDHTITIRSVGSGDWPHLKGYKDYVGAILVSLLISSKVQYVHSSGRNYDTKSCAKVNPPSAKPVQVMQKPKSIGLEQLVWCAALWGNRRGPNKGPVQVSESSHQCSRAPRGGAPYSDQVFVGTYNYTIEISDKERMTAWGIGLTTLSKFSTRESSANLSVTGTMRK